MSEYVWMHSTAHASGMAWSSLPLQAAAAARQRAGRMRLPPAKTEYRIARWIVGGFVSSAGNNSSKARLTAAVRLERKASRSNESCLLRFAEPALFLPAE